MSGKKHKQAPAVAKMTNLEQVRARQATARESGKQPEHAERLNVLPPGMAGTFRKPYPDAADVQEEIIAAVLDIVSPLKDDDGNESDPIVEVIGWNMPAKLGPGRQGQALCYVNVIARETCQPTIQAHLNGAAGPKRGGGQVPVWDSCFLLDTAPPEGDRRGDAYTLRTRITVARPADPDPEPTPAE